MLKLGLAGIDHVESNDFPWYLDLFKEGLTEEQVQLIHELFSSRVPPLEEGNLVEEAKWLVCSLGRPFKF
jgi:hypothetical protein